MKRSFLLILFIFATAFIGLAQDTSKQQAKKAKLEQEIAALNKQIKENNAKSKNALNELNLVRSKMSARRELVNESEREIAGLEDKIGSKQLAIDSLKSNLDTLAFYYSRLVRSAYKIRDSRSWYIYILASGNLTQASRRYAYLRKVSSEMNSQAIRLRLVKSQLDQEKVGLDSLKGEAQKVRRSRQNELNELAADEKTSAQLVSQLKKDKATYQAQLNQKQKQVKALNREIKNMIAAAVKAQKAKEAAARKEAARKEAARKEAERKEAEKKKALAQANSENTSSGSTTTTSTAKTETPKPKEEPEKVVVEDFDMKLSSEFAANRGRLSWPASGTVVEHYGQHYHPVYTTVKLPFNNGVTIAVSPGTKAKAVFEGTVQDVIVMPGYNQCVLVQHGGYFTFYCKLKSVVVRAGQKVSTGQVIGTVDTIEGQTQLHFQLWQDSTPQNPEIWLR